jgi:NAD(P)-dependent dehydrogenase (short-subunit alcohol dehydrogenase family)
VVKTAVVTGSNRGIGEEVARELAREGFRVIGTSREPGAEHPLDIADPASIDSLAKSIESLDVLVNNAGLAMDGFDANVAKRTIDVNLRGTMRITDALLPKIRKGGNIVNVSSGMGQISILSRALQEQVMDAPDRDAILRLANEFVSSVENGTHERKGWPSSAYSVSKALLNAFTRVLARELEPQNIRVSSVCPGWVRTRMGGRSAPRSVEEGAAGIVWAAKNANGVTGGFFRDGHAVPW